MCDAKALVKEADEKIEVNKGYLEQAEQKANDAADYADRAGNYLEEVVGQKTDVEKLIANIDVKVEESTTNIANITEAKMNDISSLTEAKSNDIATLTTAKLGDINNTAQAQIESINTVANQNTKSGIEAVNAAARAQIGGIHTVADAQKKGITETAQGKIKDINNTATSQISAINNTATNQIKAINKTAQSQIKNMTIKYSDMCRTLGIEHEGIMLAKTSYNGNESGSIPPDIYSIDVSKFRYIEFGKIVVTYPNGDYEYTLPSDNISIYLTNLKDDPALKDVTTGKRYDVSLLNDLQFYVSYIGSGGYETTVNYKLYNKLEETTEE